jgi:hypothetical protein
MALTYAQTVDALKGGDRIGVTYPRPDVASERVSYFLVSSGRSVRSTAFRKLHSEGRLTPSGDGLFGDSQSFSLVEA